jgi:hypothetical protein
MAVRLPQWSRRFAQVVELAQLVRHPGQGRRYGIAQAALAIGKRSGYRDRQRGHDFLDQLLQLGARGRQETARAQNRT